MVHDSIYLGEMAQHLVSVGPVTLKVFDLLGREIATLVDEVKTPGEHSVSWNAAHVGSGTYFYRLQAGERVAIKKLIIVR